METVGADVVLKEVEPSQPGSEQILPPAIGDVDGTGGTAGGGGVGGRTVAMPEDPVARLRADLRRLAEDVDAIDRRDAAQHGGLKGEIAHLVRRVARLEALPKVRQAR